MPDGSDQALLYPFTDCGVSYPDAGAPLLLVNGSDIASYSDIENLHCYQWLKGPAEHFSTLSMLKSMHEDFPDSEPWPCILLRIPKNTEEARYVFARSYLALKQGGLLVAAAANDAGGKRIAQFFQELGLDPYSESKFKCRVSWAYKEDNSFQVVAEKWIKNYGVQPILDGSYISQPGLFSWNKIDAGSQFLIEHCSKELAGNGADFGCGWGFLSCWALENCLDLVSMMCIDHDKRALQACQKNCETRNTEGKPVQYLWRDLSKDYALDNTGANIGKLDWILCNPPFHVEKLESSNLGKSFIRNAHSMLKARGTLWVVANQQLPYERELNQYFSNIKKIAEDKGYKIYEARR